MADEKYASYNLARKKLILGSFLRLMISNVFVLVATCACGFIDNLFIGQFMGKEALAAVGFFSPVVVAVGLTSVVIIGTQMLCANYVGSGDNDRVDQLFLSTFMSIIVVMGIFSMLCFLFRSPLATLLGADGDAHTLLMQYITGYFVGMVPQGLAAMLMSLTSFNNDLKRSYLSTAVMICGNIIGDMTLIGPLGLLGIGLASTLSSIASFLVLLPGFLNKDKIYALRFAAGFNLRLVLAACYRGVPSLMFSIGLIIKNYSFNYALKNYTGNDGVAVANVMCSVCGIVGAVVGGCYNTYASFASLYYGEEDRESYLEVSKIAMIDGGISCTATVLAMALLSGPLSALFFPGSLEMQEMSRWMFVLAFTFLIPNLYLNILLKSYQTQGKMELLNIISVSEVASVGIVTLITVPVLGITAAWLSNTIVDIACIIVILISVLLWKKSFDLSLPAILKLPDEFGCEGMEVVECSIKNVDEIVGFSDKMINFCEGKGASHKIAYNVGLCIEEMAYNILQHGGKNKNYSVDIRLVLKDKLTVRIRDNCKEFNPKKYVDLINIDDPFKNIGLRLVSKRATQIDYYNNAGVNTLIMKFDY